MAVKPVFSSDQVQKTKTPSEIRDQRLKKACKQFEGIFIATMLKDSLKNAPAEKEGKDTGHFDSLKDLTLERTGEALASQKNGGVGLWRVLYESLSTQDNSKEGEPASINSLNDPGKGEDDKSNE